MKLGIDYGTKKMGIALSDEGESFAFPHSIVEVAKMLDVVAVLVAEKGVDTIVLGYSVASNGAPNELARGAETFKTKLEALGVSVVLQREDFSSVEAHRYQTKKGDRDDSAAAIILQRFLDKNRKID